MHLSQVLPPNGGQSHLLNKTMKKLLLLFLFLFSISAFGQSRIMDSALVKRGILLDSTAGVPTTPGAGKGIITSRGNDGLYYRSSDGDSTRLDGIQYRTSYLATDPDTLLVTITGGGVLWANGDYADSRANIPVPLVVYLKNDSMVVLRVPYDNSLDSLRIDWKYKKR